jgi:hypothetical protein
MSVDLTPEEWREIYHALHARRDAARPDWAGRPWAFFSSLLGREMR